MKKGMLIVIESGTDASGKATQAEKLCVRLQNAHVNAIKAEFPNYKSESSALIKMYLKGEFGENPEQVNPYASSTFFAVDRFATYQKELKSFYETGGIIIADRYSTSNMIYQSSKFEKVKERDEFLEWLWDLEFKKFELPEPKHVIFLDIPPQVSINLLKKRKEKIIDLNGKDIHEKDINYINKTYQNAKYIAKKFNWKIINCMKNNKNLKTIEEIHEEIYSFWELIKKDEGI